MKVYKLDDWAVVTDPYLAPEIQRPKLCGKVYNHNFRKDGEEITTSAIVKVEGRLVHTRNSVYELLDIDPEWDKIFPDAEARFFATWHGKDNAL